MNPPSAGRTNRDDKTAVTAAGGQPSLLKPWFAVASTALGLFSLMTTELLPIGLLAPISADLGNSLGTTGLLVTGAVLLLYGCLGIAGNFLAGVRAARDGRQTLTVIIGLLAAALLLFPVLGRDAITGMVVIGLWGFAYGGVPAAEYGESGESSHRAWLMHRTDEHLGPAARVFCDAVLRHVELSSAQSQ